MEIHQLLNSDDDDEGVGASCIAADANNVDPPSAPVTTDPRQPYRNIDDDRVLAASILSGLRYGSRDDASHHHCQSQSFSGYQPKQGHEQRAFPISPDSLRGYPSGPASSSPGTASKAHQLHTSLFGRSLDQAFGTPKVLSAPIKKEQSSRSSTVDIKTPKDNTFAERFRSPQHNETDEATAKAIEAALNEFGTRRRPRRSFSSIPTPKSALTPKSTTPRTPKFAMTASPSPALKEAAPAAAAPSPLPAEIEKSETPKADAPKPGASELDEPKSEIFKPEGPNPDVSKPAKPVSKPVKKGVAKKPPSSSKKKRKLNDGSPAPSFTSTTAPRSKKKSAAPPSQKPSQSATPVPSVPSPAASEPESVEDENVVYCICRKPDNHTWMIGCDGGCDDWYHGKCVQIEQEKEELIDRYICPLCTANGVGVTTWKPMCRRPGCNRPARLKKGAESKYCSDACGEDFFKEQLALSGANATRKPSKKRPASEVDGEDEAEPNPLGGALKAPTLKSLISSVDNAASFRRLGSPEALTPPNSRPGTSSGPKDADLNFTDHEKARLQEIDIRKTRLRNMRVALKEREDFVRLTRERATRAKERNGGKAICGYDSRLAWDEVTFSEWRHSESGKHALEQQTLSPDDAKGGREDSRMCEKKSCDRHRGWAKLALHEVRFDEEQVREEMKRLIEGEEGMRRLSRARTGDGESGAKAGGGEVHGWVEDAKA